jgi:hypothetical protein
MKQYMVTLPSTLLTIISTNHAGHFQRAMPNQLFGNTLKSLRVKYVVLTTPPKPNNNPTWKIFMTCLVGVKVCNLTLRWRGPR